MQVLALVWGVLASLGLFIGFFPCLGALNWINIPFAVVGLVVSAIAASQAPPGHKGMANAGVVLCAIASVLGVLRLFLGGGVL
jgi:hypothetical protein